MGFGDAIREPSGKIIAWVQVDSVGNKILRNFNGAILGKYDSRLNVTRDFYGKMIARGDALMTLLR